MGQGDTIDEVLLHHTHRGQGNTIDEELLHHIGVTEILLMK